MFYLVRMPWWLKKIYSPSLIWRMPVGGGAAAGASLPADGSVASAGSLVAGGVVKTLYLTFDDGPHPFATPFVLGELAKYKARATFFCIGKNVKEHPQLYRQLLVEGHRVGNHTHDHLNGWKTDDGQYLDNIYAAAQVIDSDLFRPPYGRIRKFQSKLLQGAPRPYRIIMWDVLSADFDTSLTGEKCMQNVIRYARPGSIVVFHDSEKAFDRLRRALPAVLEHFSGLGYRFEAIV